MNLFLSHNLTTTITTINQTESIVEKQFACDELSQVGVEVGGNVGLLSLLCSNRASKSAEQVLTMDPVSCKSGRG